MPPDLDLASAALRMLAAAGFAAMVGWERESRDKPAGFRTHVLVGLGASTFTILGISLFRELESGPASNIDPIRVIEGIVGGIGFLGAGAIVRSGGNVEGVTTAAGIWVVGALGVACGIGDYALAGVVAGFTLVTLALLGAVECRLAKRRAGR